MNNRLLTMVAMLPAAFAGMFLVSSNKAGGQLATAINPLSVIQGPVEADVTKVTDGDTLVVSAYGWPGQATVEDVRVRGVDSPEIRGKCQKEKDLANAARTFVQDLIQKEKGRVKLTVIGCNQAEGAGFGRCLANVLVGDKSLAKELIAKGLARENFGEKRGSWCPGP